MRVSKREKRISFGEFDVAHLYSLAADRFCVSKKEGVCAACLNLKHRIEKSLGDKEVRSIRHQLKKHPWN